MKFFQQDLIIVKVIKNFFFDFIFFKLISFFHPVIDLMKLFSSLPQDINYDDDQSDLLQFASSDVSNCEIISLKI